MSTRPQFTQGIGRWVGTAEVYDGTGHFLGNATDRRHVQQEEGGRIRIDLSFVGPFKFAGHYYIQPMDGYRLYQGPANTGYAETLASNLIDANAYWPLTGLSQRFFLMILPDGNHQMSLGLMSRGEQLLYVVVGEYHRVNDEDSGIPELINGTAFDLQDDPAAGRGDILLHRTGAWQGNLQVLDSNLDLMGNTDYYEQVAASDDNLQVRISRTPFDEAEREFTLQTNNWQAWSTPGEVTGSYSLSGGRALSGTFHHLPVECRVWRREVVSHDGAYKAVVHTWFRGGVRLGVTYGTLAFESA